MSAALFEQSHQLSAINGVRHGFFGRLAGDMSETLGTDPVEVAGNKSAACDALDLRDSHLISLRQTHSNIVLKITDPLPPDARPEADGAVTATPGIALSILTADCAPLLFADPEAGVIGACHSGWKGAVNGIISNTINEMQALGAHPDRIVAAIGPTISGPNYEVGPDFAAEISDLNPVAKDYLFVPEGKSREHFDLTGFAICLPQLAGVRQVEQAGGCTFGNPQRYFSHRQTVQNDVPAGRQIAIIALR